MPDAVIKTAEVRAWARSQGIAVGDRGRIAPDLIAAYRAQQQPETLPAETQSPATSPRAGVRTVRAKARWDWNRPDL